jgi:hypothetical protein
MATRKTTKSSSSRTKKVDGTKAVALGGGPFGSGLHPGSRDSSYRGTLHWDKGRDGKAYLIKPPGGQRVLLEYCHVLPVSGEFDIETQSAAGVTRDP